MFGSNTEGRHGKGAAKQALKFGAIYSKSRGPQGNTYAICTKDLTKGGKSVPLDDIKFQLDILVYYAIWYKPKYEFLLTPVGTGLGGYSIEELELILPDLPANIIPTWRQK